MKVRGYTIEENYHGGWSLTYDGDTKQINIVIASGEATESGHLDLDLTAPEMHAQVIKYDDHTQLLVSHDPDTPTNPDAFQSMRVKIPDAVREKIEELIRSAEI